MSCATTCAGCWASSRERRRLPRTPSRSTPRSSRTTTRPSTTCASAGRDLLRRSADVYDDDEAHPAYARILQQLAPDEARILRLLASEGPQPAVDVRTAGPLAIARSELVAPGLNMIGPAAGAKHPERIKAYLNNLYRLGLIWFSREPMEDPLEYQVLEAQPEVAEAMEEAGPRQDRPPLDPPDRVRRGLLQAGPARGHRRAKAIQRATDEAAT